MNALVTTWQGKILLVGAGIIVVLLAVLFFVPSPDENEFDPSANEQARTSDVIDDRIEQGSFATVVLGPMYADLDGDAIPDGVMLFGFLDASENMRYTLSVSPAIQAGEFGRGVSIDLPEGFAPKELLQATGNIVEIQGIPVGAEDDTQALQTLRYGFEQGELRALHGE